MLSALEEGNSSLCERGRLQAGRWCGCDTFLKGCERVGVCHCDSDEGGLGHRDSQCLKAVGADVPQRPEKEQGTDSGKGAEREQEPQRLLGKGC